MFLCFSKSFPKTHGREVVSFCKVSSLMAYKYLMRIIVLFLVSHYISLQYLHRLGEKCTWYMKSRNYKYLVNTMLQKLQEIKVNLSLKIYILHSHMDFFPENLGAVRDEHGQRIHQDIAKREKRYQGKWTVNALADYCWSLMTDELNAHHRRACKRKNF